MTVDERSAIPGRVARDVLRLPAAAPVRVAVDGFDGAGKTTFADALARALAPAGRQVIRASVDGFHNPRAVRHARGRDSPEGFFEDSYDYARLRQALLDPLSPGGSRRFRRAAFDHRTDSPVTLPVETADEDAILVLDGIFLHRDELAGYWDHSIWLDVPPAVAVARCAARDGSSPDPAAPANRRYVLGQQLYLARCDPLRRATCVIDNE